MDSRIFPSDCERAALCCRLRRREAAQYVRETHGIPLQSSTLAKLAVVGGGPPFRKAGRIPLYETGDLDAWAASKLGPQRRSTSDCGVPAVQAERGVKIKHARNGVRRDARSRVVKGENNGQD
jgi:hypothetical protein